MNIFQECENGQEIDVETMVDMLEVAYPDKWIFFDTHEYIHFAIFHSYQQLKEELQTRYDIEFDIPEYIKEVEETQRDYIETLLIEELDGCYIGRAFDMIIDELMEV